MTHKEMHDQYTSQEYSRYTFWDICLAVTAVFIFGGWIFLEGICVLLSAISYHIPLD